MTAATGRVNLLLCIEVHMKFKDQLHEGVLLQRYKRFFADVELKGEKYTIHVPNTGSLKAVIDKSAKQKCWFSLHGDTSKKLQGTLEAVQAPNGTWVGVNTANPNKIVQEAIQAGMKKAKPHFKHWDYGFYKSEYKISKETRLDGIFCKAEADLEAKKAKKHFIEIKNTTYVEEHDGKLWAMFPDSVTERGQKHIKEMMELMADGHQAEFIFTVQRSDVVGFKPAAKLDPEYAKLLKQASKKGLIITPVIVSIDANEVKLTQKVLPVNLD
ncbi:MAG: sugar fermentation stimulation protein [Pseudobdellovibrio sp.]|nr:sugar fermentation stimulation protein [Pseudobdellovibrio sp.]